MHILLLLLALVMATPAMAQFTNEPAGSTRVATCNWTVTNCPGGYIRGQWFNPYFTPMVSTSGRVSPPWAADAALINPIKSAPLGSGTQGGTDMGFIDDRVDREMYFGVEAMHTSIGANIPGTTKFLFLRSNNNGFGNFRTNGFWGFYGRDNTYRTIGWGHNTSGLDNYHACGGIVGEGGYCGPNVGSGDIILGQWFRFEACIRASTTSTSRDGVLRWWINGVLVGNYTNINYGSGNVNEWWWSQTWDGYGNSLGYDGSVHQYIDHLIISVPPNGGCGGVPTTPVVNPPGAPAAPVLESVTPQ